MQALNQTFRARWQRVLVTLVIAFVAALAAQAAHIPLPWMIGPLFAVAGLRIAGLELAPMDGGRQLGQWAIGAALGLYFSPPVIAELARNAPLVIAAASGSLLVGLVCARIMLRLGGSTTDPATAFFASLPGGASEMAVLADRWGGAVDRIAAAHAIRVMMVVSIVPIALTLADVHGSDVFTPFARDVIWARLPLLVAASLAGVAVFRLLAIANAWVLGPLLGVALATAFELPLSALPTEVINGGQLLIGCSLGCRFSRSFFRSAPRFIIIAALTSGLSITLGFVLALMLGWVSEAPIATLSLATAPGGVSEMCITAKVLQLGVPLVTACHVLRVVFITLGAQPAFALFGRWVEKRA